MLDWFAGPRVVKETIGKDLPAGFQRAEFVLEHGFLDAIMPRAELKNRLALRFKCCTLRMTPCWCAFSHYLCTSFISHFEHLNDFAHVLRREEEEFFTKHGKGATDTGSPEGQIAMFSFRIAH